MTSWYDTLAVTGNCERCQHVHELVPIKSNGEEYEVCRECATRIQVGRVA